MKLADIETARTQASRLKQANEMMALIDAGTARGQEKGLYNAYP